MKLRFRFLAFAVIAFLITSCGVMPRKGNKMKKEVTAKDILGNSNYLAISYGGYRARSRTEQPTIAQLKEDMRILAAMNIKLLRTYNVQLEQASNLLEAIRQLREEDKKFEMYVMLGAWIDCKNAWTDQPPNHDEESDQNPEEIERAVALAKAYPEVVKIIAVGNEAMIRWATSYYVQPRVILKYVNYLQDLKLKGELPESLWITSSDDFASWGGGEESYHTQDLADLVRAVDFVSMHTYPFHNTHYNPEFWRTPRSTADATRKELADAAMVRARDFAISQYNAVSAYIQSLGVEKPIHIGETGWATVSNGHYGPEGSNAADQYKEAQYYNLMRAWTAEKGISCFYFEAFDEPWKDANNSKGSENHFGLFTVDGQAKFALWDLVDKGRFKGLTRDGRPIGKSFNGDQMQVMESVAAPPVLEEAHH
jgi:exo-beta-1,3-glucanase (GH17 family)